MGSETSQPVPRTSTNNINDNAGSTNVPEVPVKTKEVIHDHYQLSSQCKSISTQNFLSGCLNLPNDILFFVGSFLEFSEIVKMSIACRHIYSLMSNDRIWKPLCEKIQEEFSAAGYLKLNTRCCWRRYFQTEILPTVHKKKKLDELDLWKKEKDLIAHRELERNLKYNKQKLDEAIYIYAVLNITTLLFAIFYFGFLFYPIFFVFFVLILAVGVAKYKLLWLVIIGLLFNIYFWYAFFKFLIILLKELAQILTILLGIFCLLTLSNIFLQSHDYKHLDINGENLARFLGLIRHTSNHYRSECNRNLRNNKSTYERKIRIVKGIKDKSNKPNSNSNQGGCTVQ